MNLKEKLIASFDDDNRSKTLYKIMKSEGKIKLPVYEKLSPNKVLSSANYLRRQA
jgi:hypothetical protein